MGFSKSDLRAIIVRMRSNVISGRDFLVSNGPPADHGVGPSPTADSLVQPRLCFISKDLIVVHGLPPLLVHVHLPGV